MIVTIGASGSDPEAEVRLVEAQRRQRARAVILAGSRFADSPPQRWLVDEIAAIQAGGGRVVTIGRSAPGSHAVVVDNAGGAADLARSLWSLGYRRFAVLTGPEYLMVSEERLTGFRDALAALGGDLPGENVLAGQISRDGGYAALRDLLDHGVEAECVFAVDDSMAMGAVAALRDSGIRVPEDVAVAGFGDIAALRDVVPGLTTVRLPLVRDGPYRLDLAVRRADATEPPLRQVSRRRRAARQHSRPLTRRQAPGDREHDHRIRCDTTARPRGRSTAVRVSSGMPGAARSQMARRRVARPPRPHSMTTAARGQIGVQVQVVQLQPAVQPVGVDVDQAGVAAGWPGATGR